MKILEKNFSSRGFDFKQVHREHSLAIYEKRKPSASFVGYEVIVIKSHNGYVIAGNHCPPAEVFPSSEQWGTLGFSYTTKEDAYKKFDVIKNQTTEEDPSLPKRGRGRPKGSKNKS